MQASEPAIMTAAVTVAERPGGAMASSVFLSPPFQGGVARSAGVVSARNHTTPPASPAPLLKTGGDPPRTSPPLPHYPIAPPPPSLPPAQAPAAGACAPAASPKIASGSPPAGASRRPDARARFSRRAPSLAVPGRPGRRR